jgi:hypothetical protein
LCGSSVLVRNHTEHRKDPCGLSFSLFFTFYHITVVFAVAVVAVPVVTPRASLDDTPSRHPCRPPPSEGGAWGEEDGDAPDKQRPKCRLRHHRRCCFRRPWRLLPSSDATRTSLNDAPLRHPCRPPPPSPLPSVGGRAGRGGRQRVGRTTTRALSSSLSLLSLPLSSAPPPPRPRATAPPRGPPRRGRGGSKRDGGRNAKRRR